MSACRPGIRLLSRKIQVQMRSSIAILFLAGSLWAQNDTTASSTENPPMATPAPVSVMPYAVQPAAAERSNYLRGGLSFTTAYADNVTFGMPAVSDVSYSIFPNVSLDITRSRLHWTLTYAPGFTFYQKVSAYNQQNQNLATTLEYRMSPHVTLSLRDTLVKTSNLLNQPFVEGGTTVSGEAQTPNFSLIAPLADVLSNTAGGQLSYQFAPNQSVGVSGTFSNLHYPNPTQVVGLYDSTSQGGSAFYSHRISRKHYVGANYQYQRLLAYPTGFESLTETHGIMGFYTFYVSNHFSISFFGGPQYSNTTQLGIVSKAWTPAAGASFNWQGRTTGLAGSYSHVISGGGGLIGAVHLDTGTGSITQQLSRYLSGSLAFNYANNDLVSPLPGFSTGGTSISGTASVQQRFGEHLSVQLGYTRLHQEYIGIGALMAPDQNREWASISYTFARPLGR